MGPLFQYYYSIYMATHKWATICHNAAVEYAWNKMAESKSTIGW